VSGRLVTASYDLLSEIRRGFHRLADHERAELDPMFVQEVEHAGNALVMAVGRRKRWSADPGLPFNWARITPPAPEIGWPPPSNISERDTANRAPFGQKRPAFAVRGIDGRRRGAGGAGQATGGGSGATVAPTV